MRSTTRFKFGRVASLFPEDTLPEMHAKMARLCVLYEDLRLEISAILDDDFLRQNSYSPVKKEARQFYFARRLVGTIREFSAGLIHLDQDKAFRLLKRDFKHLTTWDAAVTYFRANEEIIRNVRDDIGGHFQLRAAEFAIGQLHKTERGEFHPKYTAETGSIEYCPARINPRRDDKGRPNTPLRLHFTASIVAATLFKHSSGDDPEERMKALLDVFWKAYGHANHATNVLMWGYLLERLKQ